MKIRQHFLCYILMLVFLNSIPYTATAADMDNPGELYAQSAVLMDASSGRILYEKDGRTSRPNASTTKVMTCILALEMGKGDDYVQVSEKAASQPEIKLGMHTGEQYYLEDLLYSLMLKSHNDTAVAIAEHIGGTVEGFADLMNAKATEIGCKNTHFITPNGLDASDSDGIHSTTASDLALIMRYVIQNNTFLKITETRDYSFSEISGKRTFSLHNANVLLDMTEGVLSGKTGFTADAGYCYVCACQKNGKTFIISLLACGWPDHRDYKWKDTFTLLEYGDQNYEYRSVWKEPEIPLVHVQKGITERGNPWGEVYVNGTVQISRDEKKLQFLLPKDQPITSRLQLKKEVTAPVKKGQKLGQLDFFLKDQKLASYPVNANENIQKISYSWCIDHIFDSYFH